MTRIGETLDSIESGQISEETLTTLPVLSEALSALCMEDIANTLRVLAFGPAKDGDEPAEHSHSPGHGEHRNEGRH